MASNTSIDELKAEIARLQEHNLSLVHEILLLRNENNVQRETIESLEEKNKTLLDHVPAGSLPAPSVFGRRLDEWRLPRHMYGSFSPDDTGEDEADGAAAAGGGRPLAPSVARSLSSHGPPVSAYAEREWIVDKIPSLYPSYNTSSTGGYWNYWEKLPDGRFRWSPKWFPGSPDDDE